MLKSIECENISENTHLSEPHIELNLIASINPSKTEYKSVKFSKFETNVKIARNEIIVNGKKLVLF